LHEQVKAYFTGTESVSGTYQSSFQKQRNAVLTACVTQLSWWYTFFWSCTYIHMYNTSELLQWK